MDLNNCTICPHLCGVDRSCKQGFCRSSEKLHISTFQLHFWEEPVLSGTRGSGTIFFSHCNMRCVYCQNYQISQYGHGKTADPPELKDIMLSLQESGAHNINLVTPTHVTPLIRDALIMAKHEGLQIPVVWNSNAYERIETLQELEGLVDMYLPDLRYAEDETAYTYSGIKNYTRIARQAIREMKRQTGRLKTDEGIAWKGLLIRLLVLPGNINRVDLSLDWIARVLGVETSISLLGQYYPAYKSFYYPEINKGTDRKTYRKIADHAAKLGFDNGFLQETGSSRDYTPDFPE